MAKHLYDLSRRMDDGKWLCVGKAYENEDTGKVTMFIDPVKMKQAIKGHKENIPFTMFSKKEPFTKLVPEDKVAPVAQKPPHAGARPKVPNDITQAPPIYIQPPQSKPSDDWPADFDENIPF